MSEQNNLKEDFKNWLSDVGLTVSEVDLENEDFHLVVEKLTSSQFSFEVGKPTGKSFIRLITNARFTPETCKQLRDSGTTGKKFLTGIQRELLKFQVEFEFRPNKENLEQIILHVNMYPDNITQTTFMNTYSNLKNAMLFFIWGLAQKITPESDPAQFRSTGANLPYG